MLPKRLSAIEYFINKLQETHSTFDDENIWKNDCNVPVFYFLVNKQIGNKNGRILILDVNIDEIGYVLVNIYNANTEAQHVIVR